MRVLKNIFYIFYIVIITLVLSELILRYVFPSNMSVTLKQNIEGLKPEITIDEYVYGYRTRSMESKVKPERTIRILCLGASTTEQVQLDLEDMWSAILDKQLNEEFSNQNIRIEVAALSNFPFTVWDGVYYTKAVLDSFKPDIVINLWGINSLSWLGGEGDSFNLEEKKARLKHLPFSFKLGEWKEIALKHSHLMRRTRVLRMRITRLFFEQPPVDVTWYEAYLNERKNKYRALELRDSVDRGDDDPFHAFSEGLDLLLNLLKEQGVRTLVLGQPVMWKPELSEELRERLWFFVETKQGPFRLSPKWMAQEMARYNAEQETLSETHGATFLNLDNKIPKTKEMFFDDCHFTVNGSLAVADVIYPTLLNLVRQVAQDRKLI